MKQPIVPQFTEDEYLRWEEARLEKYELHHGFVVAFASATIAHDDLAYRLRKILERSFPLPCRTFGSDVKIRITDDLFFYPDAGVASEPIDAGRCYVDRPHVVAEVLSPRTHAYDVIEKRAAYRSLPSLAAYVIVHTDMPRVEVDTRRPGGTWQTTVYDIDEDVLLNGQNISLAEIYGPNFSA